MADIKFKSGEDPYNPETWSQETLDAYKRKQKEEEALHQPVSTPQPIRDNSGARELSDMLSKLKDSQTSKAEAPAPSASPVSSPSSGFEAESSSEPRKSSPSNSYGRQGIAELERLANQYKSAENPDTRASLLESLKAAESKYQDETGRNGWAELAQMLGRAGAQYAASQAGMKSGRDNSNLNFIPPVDYEKRNERAQRGLELEQRRAGVLSDIARQRYLDEEKANKEQFDRRADIAKLKVTEAGREMDAKDRREALDREDDRKRREQLGLVGKELSAAEAKAQKRQQALSNIKSLDDKQFEKQLPTINKLLSESGIDTDASQIRQEIEDQKGIFKSAAREQEDINKVLSPYAAQGNLLESARSLRNEYDSLKPQARGGQAPAQPSTPKSKVSKQQLAAYAAQYKISPDEARRTLAAQGFDVE